MDIPIPGGIVQSSFRTNPELSFKYSFATLETKTIIGVDKISEEIFRDLTKQAGGWEMYFGSYVKPGLSLPAFCATGP